MENLALKMKISVLWLFTIVCMLGNAILMIMEPGVIEEVMSGVMEGMEIGPAYLFMGALMVWAPATMAFLTWVLNGSASRKLNIVLGIVFTGLMCLEFVEHAKEPSAHATLLGILTFVAPALIVWYAYKWPKKEA